MIINDPNPGVFHLMSRFPHIFPYLLHIPLLGSISVPIEQLHHDIIHADQVVLPVIAPKLNAQFARGAHSLEECRCLAPHIRTDARNPISGCDASHGRLERVDKRKSARAVSVRQVELEVGRDAVVLARAGCQGLLEIVAGGGAVGAWVEGGGEGIFAAGEGAAGT